MSDQRITNADRAGRAQAVVDVYRNVEYEEGDMIAPVTDLMADLLHLVDQNGGDPDKAWRLAWHHYEYEVIEEIKDDDD